MATQFTPRNYSLTGPECEQAGKRGLASAEWYQCPIPRQRMKELLQRRDGPAIRDTIVWFGLMIVSGVLGFKFWGTWWAVPCFFVYWTVYGSTSDSRWHEAGHRTAFKTTWMNDVLYEIASFMVFRESVVWRWSHARHHTDTIIVGCDREIPAPRPPNLLAMAGGFLNIPHGPQEFKAMLIHCLGKLRPDEKLYIPASEHPKLFRNARIYVLIYAGVITWAIVARTWLPLMYVGLPSFFGQWLMIIYGITQHAGMAEDVLDHRLNSRTVYMNPINRFLYWEMNYHVEHHMFPMVPYHALGKLHQEIKADMPKPYGSIWEAYREIIPALLRQRKDPTYYVKRELPPAAKPSAAPIPA